MHICRSALVLWPCMYMNVNFWLRDRCSGFTMATALLGHRRNSCGLPSAGRWRTREVEISFPLSVEAAWNYFIRWNHEAHFIFKCSLLFIWIINIWIHLNPLQDPSRLSKTTTCVLFSYRWESLRSLISAWCCFCCAQIFIFSQLETDLFVFMTLMKTCSLEIISHCKISPAQNILLVKCDLILNERHLKRWW